jgi:hypothetical protein
LFLSRSVKFYNKNNNKNNNNNNNNNVYDINNDDARPLRPHFAAQNSHGHAKAFRRKLSTNWARAFK